MGQEQTPDTEVASWLAILGLASLCQWDLLAFLYRHQAALVGSDDLARLLGYPTESVVAAMDALASLGLVERSRVSHGARFYQFIMPSDSPHGEAFVRLLALASHRVGRLRLAKQLQQDDQTDKTGLQGTRPLCAESRQVARAVRLRSQKCENREFEGRAYERKERTWRKAI
jgi:DNA-binding MarR family transcriptional regulator